MIYNREQTKKMDSQHEDILSQLVSLQLQLSENPRDIAAIKSKVNLMTSNLRISLNNNKLSQRVITDNLLDNFDSSNGLYNTAISDIQSINDDFHFHTDPIRNEVLNFPNMDISHDFSKRSRSRSKTNKIDPAYMRPAGVKSNTDQIYRHDSVQYLDVNRNKTDIK